MRWEYKQVLARRNTFEHELELSEPSDVGSSATQKDDSEPEQTQKASFIKERMQTHIEQITKEIPGLIQTSVANGSSLERFMKNVETAVRSENPALAKRWWEQWWEAHNSSERPFSWYAKDIHFAFVVPMLDSIQLATADSALSYVFEEVLRQQNNMNSEYFEISLLNKVVPWCVKNNLLVEGWRIIEAQPSTRSCDDASYALLSLCVASVQQGFVDSVEDLGPRLDKVRFEDPKKLNNLLEQMFAKVSFENAKSSVDEQPQGSYLTPKQMLELQKKTLPREDVVMDTMGQEGWECFQVRYHTLWSENDSVVLYFKRPQTTSLDVAQLKPSVQAFFTK